MKPSSLGILQQRSLILFIQQEFYAFVFLSMKISLCLCWSPCFSIHLWLLLLFLLISRCTSQTICISVCLWAVTGICNYFSFETHKTCSATAPWHTHTHTHTYAHISLVLFVIINPFGDLRIFSVKLKGLFFCWTKPHQKTRTLTHIHTRRHTHDDTHTQNDFVV